MANRLTQVIGANAADGAVTGLRGNAIKYLVQTPQGVLYYVYNNVNSDLIFKKSTNFGVSWDSGTTIFTGTINAFSVWYDRWSNISAGLIHIAYTETDTDDTLYRTIDTENSDTLSTQTTIFTGASAVGSGHLSIVRAVGGNVYCKTVIDAGVEGGFFRLPNANVPNGAWDAARTVDEAIATQDVMILQPDFDAADTQDILAFFWDVSADEISRKLYDDSANSWSETSISTGMVDPTVTFAIIGTHCAAAPDISGTKSYLIAWNGIDTANADLKAWSVDSGTITALTDVVTNGTDDQGLAALAFDTATGYLHAFYGGKSDGSETYNTSINIYTKISTDSGSTWGAETAITNGVEAINRIFTTPRFNSAFGYPLVGYLTGQASSNQFTINYPHPSRKLTHLLYGG